MAKFSEYSIALGVRISRRMVGIVGEPGYVYKVHAKRFLSDDLDLSLTEVHHSQGLQNVGLNTQSKIIG